MSGTTSTHGVFSLTTFNVSHTTLLGKFLASTFESFETDCEAVIYIKTSTLREMFRFQTDGNSVGDFLVDDLKFFIDRNAFNNAFSDSIDIGIFGSELIISILTDK